MTLQKISFYFVFLALIGCAAKPYQISIKPEPEFPRANIGQNQEVSVSVKDARPSPAVGQRGGAAITPAQHVGAVVKQKIFEGLRAYEFAPIGEAEGFSRTLKVQINRLEFNSYSGVWLAKAELAVKVTNNTAETSAIYRVERETQVFAIPAKEQTEQAVNQALSDLLTKLFKDRDLMTLLSK